jgi:AraC-like DNA-binding protein
VQATLLKYFTTSAVESTRRLRYWNELASEALGPLVVDTKDRDHFEAKLARLALGSFELCSAWSRPAIVRNRGTHRDDNGNMLNLELQYRGVSRTEQCGRIADLSPGDFVMVDPSRPYVTQFDQSIEALILRVPRALVTTRIGDPESILGVRIEGAAGCGSMLAQFLANAWAKRETLCIEHGNAMDDILSSLIDLVYHAPQTPDFGSRSAVTKRLARAKKFIDEQICDPEFTAGDVGEFLGLSQRSVQSLFMSSGETLTSYILGRRLEVAADRLRQNEGQCRVSEVAFSVGFSDLAYFSRVFRYRFGCSPRQYRDR